MPKQMVACADARAARIGLDILEKGGNAVDAGLATAAMLNVVDFANTGIGGDVFALYWKADEEKVYALNASGRAPRGARPEVYLERDFTAVPEAGPLAITVPGAVDGWWEMHQRFGSLDLGELFEPAINTAANGFELNERMANAIAERAGDLALCPAAADIFLPKGVPPGPGEWLVMKDLAGTFQMIAEQGRNAFYRGDLTHAMAQAIQDAGGVMTADDIAHHVTNWWEPLIGGYRDYAVYEMPPNSQGCALLQQLNILAGWDVANMEPLERTLRQIEAKRVSFADRDAYITDPEAAVIPLDELLSEGYAAQRREALQLDPVAGHHAPGALGPKAQNKETTYLAVVDSAGNCLSFINSLFHAMGSCFVAAGTGVLFQNRASGFSLDPGHVNVIAPSKRTMHTLNPLMVFKKDKPYLVMGTIGGDQQTAGSQQVLVNHIDLGLGIAEAVAAPRWRIDAGLELFLETGLYESLAPGLGKRGYAVQRDGIFFGGTQAILIDPGSGDLEGASDHRVGGVALGS